MSGGFAVQFLVRHASGRKIGTYPSKPVTKSAILDDGLRYKSKVSGSPFTSTAYVGASTMSCFLCGSTVHAPS